MSDTDDKNLYLRFCSNEELYGEINRRNKLKTRKDIDKRLAGRKPIAYFVFVGGDELHTVWELHTVFSNGNTKCFDFDSRDGKSEGSLGLFVEEYFPKLPKITYDDWVKIRRKKKHAVARHNVSG